MYTFNFLCSLGLYTALLVPGNLADGTILTSSADQNEIVDKHNALRRAIQPTASNMLKMSWNSVAEANAQRWANTCSMKNSPASSRKISSCLDQIGCAMAYCPNSTYKYFYVCQYCPLGNYQYVRPYKSGPSCADCPNACDNKLCTNPCPYADQYSNCPDLKQQWGCSNKDVASWCLASCKCTTQII